MVVGIAFSSMVRGRQRTHLVPVNSIEVVKLLDNISNRPGALLTPPAEQ
jgi:hypothetical protein